MSNKDDFEIDWGDDFFDGDIDFNDDFENTASKKGIIAGFTSGFLGGLVEHSIGSSEAISANIKRILPSSYSVFFDKIRYLDIVKNELIQEFKEENYENVKSLQNIAKKIGAKIDDENSKVKQKLNAFSEDDFSSWEKWSGTSEEGIGNIEGEEYASFHEDVSRLIQNQNEAAATTVSGVNQMQAEIGGGIIAAVKTGNRGLLGIESGMRDLLNYQRNVQYKLDKAMLEITAKSYVLDARYYKFNEKANHKIVEELKKITINSGKSDYIKSTDAERLKAEAKKRVFNTIGKRTGGFIANLRNSFSKDNRIGAYSAIGGMLSTLEEMLGGEGGPKIGAGGIAEVIGNTLAEDFIKAIPGLMRAGPFRELADDISGNLNEKTRNRIRSGYNKVRDFGNTASYLATSGGGLLNYYSRDWKDLKVDRFLDYDDYLDYAEENGIKPVSKMRFMAMNTVGNAAKEGINRMMFNTASDRSKGTQYTLLKRTSENLTGVAQWKEINNIALVDVIPGWLSKIYESQEKMRTGNDDFKSPVFSYSRGQFVDRKVAAKIVKGDVFSHNDFLNASVSAKNIVREIDSDNILTDKQANELALEIAKNADKEYGFNPYQYTGEIEGLDPKLQKVVNKLIKDKFGITDEKLNKYNSSSTLSRVGQHLTGFKGKYGDNLNYLSALVDELKNAIPNIAGTIEANRESGNEELLREMGLITTEFGTDQFNTNTVWERFKEYLLNPDNPELRSDFINVIPDNAGKTLKSRSGGTQTNVTHNHTDFAGLEQGINTLTETIQNQFGKLDLSHLNIDLQGIPDRFDTLNETATEQKTLLSKIAECVCRSANGWGSKTKTEKEKIEREEAAGKKSLLDKIKEFSPRGFFNKSIETLATNSPLVLTGIAAGLAGYAFKDPKAAALIAGGVGVGILYNKFSRLGSSKEPSDDENIYNENGDVLLYASKLRNGDYWDVTSKAVIKTWKAIKGAVYDAVNKTWVTVSQLTGKLFGPDNRRRFLYGFSKVKDFAKTVWDKIDITGTFGKLKDTAKAALYQQDVYVAGSSEPRLTRSGFKEKKYYCLDPNTRQPFVIKGWNEIKGPVYALDESNTLTQIISEEDIAQGLMTSSGMKLDALKERLNWAKDKAIWGAGKLFGYAKEKGKAGFDKASNAFKTDYTSIETRLDRIYYLLCDEFGRPVQPLLDGGMAPRGPTAPNRHEEPNLSEPLGGAFNTRTNEGNDPFTSGGDYPHKVRLNSFEDKTIKEEEHKRDTFYEDIHDIKESMEGMSGTEDDGKKKKKGLWGLLAGVLGSGFGIIKKLFTNPLGLIGDAIGLTIKSILKSPLRLVKLGSLLFKGVLGVASPIFKLMRWGFTGILSALGRGALGLIDGFLPGGTKRKKRRAAKKRLKRMKGGSSKRRFGSKKRGLAGLLAGGLALSPFMANAASGSDEYDYDDNGDYDYDDDSDGIEGGYESDYYDDSNNSDGVADSLIDGLYTADQAAYLTGAGISGIGKTAQTVAPGMSRTLAGTKAGGSALKALGGAGKLATGIGGKLFLPLTALQAGMAFTDTDTISDIFDTNVIDGRQRVSNTITDLLDFGGLTSGIAKTVGGALGFDTRNLDGMATRAVNSLLDNKLTNWLTDLPMAQFIPIVGQLKGLKEYKTDVSSIQRKIRMAMYGIKDTKEKLAIVMESVERRLTDYVQIREGYVTISKKAPLGEIAESLSQVNIPEAAVWLKSRFLPVYQLWCSAGGVLGYQNLDALDKDKGPNAVKVVNQVQAAVTQFNPYPYEIAPRFSKEYPIMNRATTEARLAELNEEMKKEFKEQGVDAEGNIETKTVIITAEEVKEGKIESGDVLDKAAAWINSKFTKLSLIGFDENKEVIEIDISDLHPGNGKEMDNLTMVRLGAYGNTESNAIKVDAVLKLERYCEGFFTIRSGTALFEKNAKEILAIFKNSFQLVPSWYEHWEKWFTGRFLPVLKTWVNEVYKLRGKLPKDGWKSLSASNKSVIGHALIDVKTDTKGEVSDIWSVEEGPFFGTTSGTEAQFVKKNIAALDADRADKLLKDPAKEKAASGPNNAAMALTDDEKYAIYHGGKKSSFNRDSGASSYSRSKGNTELDDLIKGGKKDLNIHDGTRNYNESKIPTVDTGSYSNVDSAGDSNYTPNAKLKGKEFSITPREAKKTIINEFIKAGYKDPLTLAFAIANAEVETSLQGRIENLNYKAEVLNNKFSNFKDPQLADRYGRTNSHPADQRMIARIAYGRGRLAKTLGNTGEDDGEKYIGRGFTQVTGRYNYDAVGKLTGEDFLSDPDKVGSDPIAATKSTIGFFKLKGIDKALAAGDVAKAAYIINSADTKHQREKVALTQKYLQEIQSGELKNIIDEINNGEKNSEENVQAANDANPNTLPETPIEGLDGTNKVNVPSPDSTDATAPPITTPPVSANDATPTNATDRPTGGNVDATNTSTDVSKEPQQSTPVAAPVSVTPPKPVEEKQPAKKETKSKEPSLTQVYDGAVVGAIDRLTKSLESVLSQSRRVSVSSRNA